MAIFDNLTFNPLLYSGQDGNLLDMIRTMGRQNETFKPAPFGLGGPSAGNDALPQNAAPTSGQNTIAVGDYQMPRIGFGSPMDAKAEMPAAPAATPALTAPPATPPQAQPGGDFCDRLLAGFQGFAGSKGLLPAIANGISGFNNGNQTQQFLMKKGLDAQTARTVASNPTLLKSMLPQLMGTADKTNDIKDYEYALRNGFKGSFVDWTTQSKNGGKTEYGLQPIYGTDANGNQVIGTLGKDGTFKQIDTGGVTPQSGVDKIDMGTQWMLRDKRSGQVVGYAPKDVAGEAAAKKGGALSAERVAELPKARASLASSFDSLDRLASEATAVRDAPGLGGITGVKGVFPNFPGSEAANAQAKLQTLKSQVGFSVLQAMREASKTGGALGAISDAEGARLENNLAALDRAQSFEEFQAALNKIIQFTNDAKSRLGAAFKETYPGQADTTATTTAAAPSPSGWQSLGGVKIRKKM